MHIYPFSITHLENPLKTIHFILSFLKAFPNAYAQPAICDKVIKDGYYYQVTATNSKGTVTLLKRSFLVGILISSDQLTLTNYNKPTALKVGQSFSIAGTITSAETNIQKVTVEILDIDENVVISKSAYPNTKTYNLKNIDAQVKFGSLPKGTYYYCVNATNKSVSTFFLGDTFTVS